MEPSTAVAAVIIVLAIGFIIGHFTDSIIKSHPNNKGLKGEAIKQHSDEPEDER